MFISTPKMIGIIKIFKEIGFKGLYNSDPDPQNLKFELREFDINEPCYICNNNKTFDNLYFNFNDEDWIIKLKDKALLNNINQTMILNAKKISFKIEEIDNNIFLKYKFHNDNIISEYTAIDEKEFKKMFLENNRNIIIGNILNNDNDD